MAHSLSLLIRTVPHQAHNVAQSLTSGFAGSNGPNILHYAWAVAVPQISANTVLLSTVYDEEFDPYITDLVKANPPLFDNAAKGIEGLQNMVPVVDHLPEFIKFVRDNDLTGASTKLLGVFFCGYADPDWTVDQINGQMPPPSAAS